MKKFNRKKYMQDYNSIKKCADDIGGQSSKIVCCCKGRQKTHLKLTFSYFENVEEVALK